MENFSCAGEKELI